MPGLVFRRGGEWLQISGDFRGLGFRWLEL